MALVLKDRVKETTSTTSTGTYTLSGAVTGYQAFSVIGNENTTYYAVTNGTDWEVGIGTYTLSGTTLSRDTILESSNSGNAVNWSAGVKEIFCTYPAERSMYVDGTTITPATSASLTVPNGGTGITTVAQGDIIYASASNTLTVLAKNTTATRYLSNTGTTNNPAWAQIDLSNGVTGDLPFANLTQIAGLSVLGVTGSSTADVAGITAGTDNQVLRRSGTALAFGAVNLASTDAVTGDLPFTNIAQIAGLSVAGRSANTTGDLAAITAGTDNQVLRRSGTAVGFGAVNLASTDAVTGDLPFSNLAQGSALSVLGVTGNATADNASIAAGTDHQVLRRSGTSVAFGAVNLAQSAAITGTLPVGNGGTGAATLTANNVILGNGSSAVQFVAPGSNGNVLTSNGSTWTSAAPAAAGATKPQAVMYSMIFG